MSSVLLNIIKGITGGGGDGKIKDAILKTADDLIYTKQEKEEAQREYEKAAEEAAFRLETLEQATYLKELEHYERTLALEVQDRDSARDRETAIVQAAPDKTSWITVNITPILALVVVGASFTLFYFAFFTKMELSAAQSNLVFTLLGLVGGVLTQVVAYYFGSSRGSAVKQDELNKIRKNET